MAFVISIHMCEYIHISYIYIYMYLYGYMCVCCRGGNEGEIDRPPYVAVLRYVRLEGSWLTHWEGGKMDGVRSMNYCATLHSALEKDFSLADARGVPRDYVYTNWIVRGAINLSLNLIKTIKLMFRSDKNANWRVINS